MVAKDENGHNVTVPGLILDSVEDIRRFARSIRRMEQSKKRVKRFTDSEFIVAEHIHLLEGKNARIVISKS